MLLIDCLIEKEPTDSDLIKFSQDGNQWAFSEIVRRHKSKVAATIYGMIGKCDEADDIGQEVFIRFYQSIGNFRGDSALSTYLIRIAINLSLNEIKRRNRRRFLSFDKIINGNSDIPDNISLESFNENQQIINSALQKLNEKYRTVIVLRLIDGFSSEETAKILGVPLGTVLSRLARAQMKLKKYLEPYIKEL